MGSIPSEISKTIDRLRAEANEKLRLADELYRIYSGDDSKEKIMSSLQRGGFFPDSEIISEANLDSLIDYLKKRGARVSDLAEAFHVPAKKITDLIESSEGKLFIHDWRGWVKVRPK